MTDNVPIGISTQFICRDRWVSERVNIRSYQNDATSVRLLTCIVVDVHSSDQTDGRVFEAVYSVNSELSTRRDCNCLVYQR
jgi:hypothetical protein